MGKRPNCLVLKHENGDQYMIDGDDKKLRRIQDLTTRIGKEYELDFHKPLPRQNDAERIDSLEALDTEERLHIEAELLDQ